VLGNNQAAQIDCCGTINSWMAFIETPGSVDLFLQIWRPQGGTFLLVGENQFVAGEFFYNF